MKKLLIVFIILIISLTLIGCNRTKQDTKISDSPKQENKKEVKTKNLEMLKALYVESPGAPNSESKKPKEPDILYIYEPFKSAEPVKIIKTNLLFGNHEYQLVKNKIYYMDEIKGDKLVKYLDFDGTYHSLDFVKTNANEFLVDFKISPAGDKIAWILRESETPGKDYYFNHKYLLANIDGSNIREIYKTSKHTSDWTYITKWSESGDELYFVEQAYMGDLGFREDYKEIYLVNANTGEVKNITADIKKPDDDNLIKEKMTPNIFSDISADKKYLIYKKKINGKFQIILRNLITKNEEMYSIPDITDLLLIGDAKINQEDNKICYSIATWIPNKPHDSGSFLLKKVLLDLVTTQSKVYTEDEFPYYIIDNHWIEKEGLNKSLFDKLMKNPKFVFEQQ